VKPRIIADSPPLVIPTWHQNLRWLGCSLSWTRLLYTAENFCFGDLRELCNC